jgi:CHAD domain-containing protein
MTPAYLDKWIPGTSADDPVPEVACRTLQARLAAVQHYLPLAAVKAGEDVEYVHRLRVFTRRAAAALRLYAPLVPRDRAHWVERQLRRIRHAANDARDYDVLAQRWAARGERLLAHVQERRAKAQELIVAIHQRVQRGRCLARRIAGLLRRVRPRGKNKAKLKKACFGAWARARLRRRVEKFFRVAPVDCFDVAALHRFRIRGKELRYAMEMLGGAFPPELREKLYPIIEALQDKLGAINDHATALARLCDRLREAEDPEERSHLRRVRDRERVCLEQTCRAFRAWWTPARREALRAGFKAVLAWKAGGGRRQGSHQGLPVRARQRG